MKTVRFLGLPLTLSRQTDDIVSAMQEAWTARQALLVTFINPHAWTLHQRNPAYDELLGQMDMVLPDGIAVAKMATNLLGEPVERFSFDASSLYHPLFRALNERGGKLFVIGAARGVAQDATERMRASYPRIDVVGVLDGFQPRQEAIAAIVDARPDMVVCGMGAPRQERFLFALREAGFQGAAFTCGGFLDQLALSETYYPAWVDRLEIRWLWRIWCEPKRLWRRYAIEYWPFIRLSLSRLLRSRLGLVDDRIRSQA
ncbi:MAG: WecB/TagA/CpsF family glycosyltransferase [Geminicoccaceae bacterium]|nr:WecB/TagA/CpsF family glycosyltransferase [Geminicoccaceae bacterium]